MHIPNELLFQLLAAFITGGAVYGGIRADLRSIHSGLSDVKEDTAEAHRRLDRHLEGPRP